jgi:hypothetical protein
MREIKLTNKITDTNGDIWTPHYDNQGSYYWDTDFLDKDISIYATPYWDDKEGISLDIQYQDGDFEAHFFPLTDDDNIEEELAKVLAIVKDKVKK